MQFIVISLKTGLFQNSEALVGIYRDQGANSSKALTLDVSIFVVLCVGLFEFVADFRQIVAKISMITPFVPPVKRRNFTPLVKYSVNTRAR
jgi:hypothetical protein